jgi:hypothetical protein
MDNQEVRPETSHDVAQARKGLFFIVRQQMSKQKKPKYRRQKTAKLTRKTKARPEKVFERLIGERYKAIVKG